MLTSQDVQLSTTSPRVGDAISATINVRNTTSVDVMGAKVTWTLQGDGNPVGQGEFPINVKANGSAQVQWKGTAPNVRQLLLNLTAVCSNDANPANNTAAVAISVATK